MSLMSLLLALSPPLAARFKPKPNREAELKARIAQLEIALAIAAVDTSALSRERDVWRDRAYEAVPARAIPLRNQQVAQHISLLAQYQAQQAQQSQIPPQYLLGAQNLNAPNEMVCNCVPARHDLLLLG